MHEARRKLREEIQAFPNQARAYASMAIVMALKGRQLAESRGLLVEMNRKAPGPGSRSLAARALEFIGDNEGAAGWRQTRSSRPMPQCSRCRSRPTRRWGTSVGSKSSG